MALFFNKEKEADSVFNEIEKEYLNANALVKDIAKRPTVMSGIVYGDAWFMPAGKNYAAHLLKDAGTDYLWKDTEKSGFLELSFESVFEKAKDEDLDMEQAESLQEFVEETGMDVDEAYEVWELFN